MNTFTVSTFINRPVKEVFDYTIDPANAVKWQASTISAEWSSKGPAGVGSVIHQVGKFMGRELETDAKISQWDPPSLWGQKFNSGPMKIENTNKYEAKDGGTLLVQTFQGEVGGFFKVAEGLAFKQMQKELEADCSRLKKLLEAM
jgi:hypothetical protein